MSVLNLGRIFGVAGLVSVAATGAALAEWQPDKPINIIVPWSAGGSTDQVTRVVAPILEEALGTPVVVVNQPGASGSIGTKAALDAPRDGYTWTANAIANNATYSVTGLVEDTSIEDYHIYLHVANVPVVSVNADAPYQDFGELLEAMESGDVTVGTAGVNSSGGMALAAIKEAAEGELSAARMVTYDGGNPAVLAAAAGEVAATTQLAVEQTEMIKAGRLRALAVLSDKELVVRGAVGQGTRRRGHRPDPADHQLDAGHEGRAGLLRGLHSRRRAAGGLRHRRPGMGRACDELRGAAELRRRAGGRLQPELR